MKKSQVLIIFFKHLIHFEIHTMSFDSNSKYKLIEVLLFILFFFSLIYFYNGSGWNSSARMSQVYRIVEDGKLDINPFIKETQDISIKDGVIYPNKAPGSSFLGVIPYFFIYHFEKLLNLNSQNDVNIVLLNAYLVKVFANDLLCALAVIFLFRICLFFTQNIFPALLATTVYCLGTMIWSYSSIYLGHVQATSFYLLGFYYFLKIYSVSKEEFERKDLFLASFLLSISFLIDFFMIYLILPVFFYLVLKILKRKEYMILMLLGCIVPLLCLMFYNYSCFGGFFEIPMKYNNPIFSYDGAGTFFGSFVKPRWAVFKELLFGEFYGFFSFNPALFFGVGGIISLFFDKKYRVLSFIITVSIILSFLSNISFIGWWGGSTAGPRYLIGIIPLFIIAASKLLKLRLVLFSFILVAGISIYFNLAIVATNPMPGKLSSLKTKIIPDFQQWQLSQNRSYPRLLDSSLSARHLDNSSFNLGEQCGLSKSISLFPLFLFQFILLTSILIAMKSIRRKGN